MINTLKTPSLQIIFRISVRQRPEIPVFLRQLHRRRHELAAYLAKKLPGKSLTFSVVICGHQKSQQLNGQFRQRHYPTDVLSFALYPDLRREKPPLPHLELGDLYLCYPVAKVQAAQLQVSVHEELMHLFAHGLLHLLGFDHEISRQEETKMERAQRRLVEILAPRC